MGDEALTKEIPNWIHSIGAFGWFTECCSRVKHLSAISEKISRSLVRKIFNCVCWCTPEFPQLVHSMLFKNVAMFHTQKYEKLIAVNETDIVRNHITKSYGISSCASKLHKALQINKPICLPKYLLTHSKIGLSRISQNHTVIEYSELEWTHKNNQVLSLF